MIGHTAVKVSDLVPCPHSHENYYGAFGLDPDGHNAEAVCHEAP